MLDQLPELDPFYFTFSKGKTKIYLIPQIHNSVYFSKLVTQFLDNVQIDRVLIELPIELSVQIEKAVARLPYPTLICPSLDLEKPLYRAEELGYLVHPGEALFWAIHKANEKVIPVEYIDQFVDLRDEKVPNPISIYELRFIGWLQFYNQTTSLLQQHISMKKQFSRNLHLANQILEKSNENEKIACFIGALHFPFIRKVLLHNEFKEEIKGFNPFIDLKFTEINLEKSKKSITNFLDWKLYDIHPNFFHYLTFDLPYFIGNFIIKDGDNFDILQEINSIYTDASKTYQLKFDEPVSTASKVKILQYLRNLSKIHGNIFPSFLDIVTAGKGVIDDDFGFEVYKLAIGYQFMPPDHARISDPVKIALNQDLDDLVKFTFRRRYKKPVLKKIDFDSEFDDLDPLPSEDWIGQWQDIWDKLSEFGYVSYPPEDEFIEKYFRFLRNKIINILREEMSSVTKFASSIEDGIDYRETIRNFQEGNIYVKKIPRKKFEIGALIVQFLEEPFDYDEYSYYTTMFAEHDLESHISIVSTNPGDELVGPGISRIKIAAIVSQYPPVGMPSVIPYGFEDFKVRLISGAMDMSLGKIIGYVAKKPPTAAQKYFASSNGFRLIYLPMDNLTKASINRLRIMHILSHKSLRDIAREYIGY